MCVQDYLTSSDITAFGDEIILSTFEDTIESASDDQVRWWVLTQGITEQDIEYRSEVLGDTVRDIAQELVDAGHEFSLD